VIYHPGVMALLLGSTLTSLMLLYSGYWGLAIVRGFDIRSGSERQLRLERRTYLVSTVVAYAFGFQLLSFFLFLFTADLIHPLFPGAMCAAGVLNVNRFGYPALLLKCVNFLLAGMWLILNAADNRGYDYRSSGRSTCSSSRSSPSFWPRRRCRPFFSSGSIPA